MIAYGGMMLHRVLIGLGVLLALAIGPAQAQKVGVAQGEATARKLCVNCHIIEPDSKRDQVTAGIPSFMAIANKPGITESKLRGFMLNPHPPMPEVQLTKNELDNLAAYILSLKTAQ